MKKKTPLRVIMFQPRFADMVEYGTKRQTVRQLGRVPIVAGDRLSLRRRSGFPYRTKQIELRAAICEQVDNFFLTESKQISIHRVPILDQAEKDAFARAEGFEDFAKMVGWFEKTTAFRFGVF